MVRSALFALVILAMSLVCPKVRSGCNPYEIGENWGCGASYTAVYVTYPYSELCAVYTQLWTSTELGGCYLRARAWCESNACDEEYQTSAGSSSGYIIIQHWCSCNWVGYEMDTVIWKEPIGQLRCSCGGDCWEFIYHRVDLCD